MANESEEHQELRNIASIGAKHIMDGPVEFAGWAERMMLDIGDQVRWIASRTNQPPVAVLQEIYEHASHMASLIQGGRGLAAISWMHRYADIVVKQAALDGLPYLNGSDGRLPKSAASTDAFRELCYHPSAPKDHGREAFVILGLLAVVAIFFLFTDPSAILSSRWGVFPLVALAFLLFLGSVLGYVWVRERTKRASSKK